MLEFYKSTSPKARKEYKCDLCNQLIHKDEVYYRYSGKYDGEMFDYKYHLACQTLINAYCDENDDTEYDNDSIQDWLHDKFCFDCNQKRESCKQIEYSCPIIQSYYK